MSQPVDAEAISAVLEPQPADPDAVAGWLDRLHAAADHLLPDQFTLNVPWNVAPQVSPGDSPGEQIEMTLHLTFRRHAPDWDPHEVQYRVTDEVTVPHRNGTGVTRLTATALSMTGQWLNRHRIPRPLTDTKTPVHDFGNCIVDAIGQDPIADRAVLVSELVRVIRLRQRVGETDIRNGGHDTDIDDLQNQLAATFAVNPPPTP